MREDFGNKICSRILNLIVCRGMLIVCMLMYVCIFLHMYINTNQYFPMKHLPSFHTVLSETKALPEFYDCGANKHEKIPLSTLLCNLPPFPLPTTLISSLPHHSHPPLSSPPPPCPSPPVVHLYICHLPASLHSDTAKQFLSAALHIWQQSFPRSESVCWSEEGDAGLSRSQR